MILIKCYLLGGITLEKIIHDTDKYFSFHDSPITECYFDNGKLTFEFEYVSCWLNNQNVPAVYTSEGNPKLVIELETMISWVNWEKQIDYTKDFEFHLQETIGIEFLSFKQFNNLGKIFLVGEDVEFTFKQFKVVVVPSNLYFYRNLYKNEIKKFKLEEMPKTNLSVNYFK